MATQDPNIITVSATKELFISMLVKDLSLNDAIGDLIDNSVDAAMQNAVKKNDLSAFVIELSLSGKYFSITDNCGGLEAKIARESAFHLGKPKDYKEGSYTIGQFGIGMKRAFFKMGNYINVASKALNSSFSMHIDVPKWNNSKLWSFKFDKLEESKKNLLKNTNTEILIKKLNSEVQEKFDDTQFVLTLKKEIEFEHFLSINKGLKIIINNSILKAPNINLIMQNDLKPAFWKHEFPSGLNVEIMAGLSTDDAELGGWYIFCNDRMILGPDTTSKTGWSGKGKNEMPQYHDQFHRFRGFTFFRAKKSSLLPWNTTKTGMDMDSPEFLNVRNKMILMALQVKKGMDDLKKERMKGNPESKQELNKYVKSAKALPIEKVLKSKSKFKDTFLYPKSLLNLPKADKAGTRIQFYKPVEQVKRVKSYFDTRNKDEAGENAFDYFYENEIE